MVKISPPADNHEFFALEFNREVQQAPGLSFS